MKKTANPDVWKKLIVLGEKQGSIKLKDLASEMGLGTDETMEFLRQIFPIGVGINSYQKDDECWIDIKSDAIQYMLPLSPAEWIKLHELLATSVRTDDIVGESLKQKVFAEGPIKVIMELLNQLELWDQELSSLQLNMIKKIEKAIQTQQVIGLMTTENKKYTIYPWKVLHLEGLLSLIAEDSEDHCLLVVPLQKLKNVEEIATSGKPEVSTFEIDDFITAIRSMNEKEARLILKIFDPQSSNLFPDHHFLGKPCMVTNPNGDLIWAAYVEPCEALYEWLLSLGRNVEILDPIKFKEEYLMYCEEKMRKVA